MTPSPKCLILLPVALLAAAAPASATTVAPGASGGLVVTNESRAGSTLTLRTAGPETSISIRDRFIVDLDEGLGSRCTRLSGFEVVCRRVATTARVVVRSGPGDDVVTPAIRQRVTLEAGDGSDRAVLGTGRLRSMVAFAGGRGLDVADYSHASHGVDVQLASADRPDGRPALGDRDVVDPEVEVVRGSRHADELQGTPRRETFEPGAGDDLVATVGGADRVVMGAQPDGADRVVGTSAADGVTYAARTTSITATLNQGAADDGAPDEGDDLRGIGSVEGGAGDDVLTGAPPVVLRSGISGAQPLPPASFRLTGNAGADTLRGGLGPDVLLPGAGRDSVEGDGGNDRVSAADGEADAIACGDGLDSVLPDATDAFAAATCEIDERTLVREPVRRETGVVRRTTG